MNGGRAARGLCSNDSFNNFRQVFMWLDQPMPAAFGNQRREPDMNPVLKNDMAVWKAALVCLALVGCGGDVADSGAPSVSAPLPVPSSGSADAALAPEGWETIANQYQY